MSEYGWSNHKHKDLIYPNATIPCNADAVSAEGSNRSSNACNNENYQRGGVENRPLHRYRASNTEPKREDPFSDTGA